MGDAALRGVGGRRRSSSCPLSTIVGVRFGSGVQTAFTIVKVVAVAAIIVAGALLDPAGPPSARRRQSRRDCGGGDFLLAVGAGLFAFGGWHMVTYTAEETKDPERTIPRVARPRHARS